ncbi:GNAT family N-acetyltransferase [Hyphomonas pacifica]|nr:GNAT family N-acetyltransferase [Hyphomonas pacifica]KCZ52796.1 hypothetical protein HY2_07635 [Hyphomonas pacifica]
MTVWMQAGLEDLPDISRIAAEVHAGYPESDAVFSNRLSLFEPGCFVCRMGKQIVGYLISHPWRCGQPVPLDTELTALPQGADCLYLHDIALLPAARGKGASSLALQAVKQVARQAGLPVISLVALPGTEAYWSRQGFEARPCTSLESYGPGVSYRERGIL